MFIVVFGHVVPCFLKEHSDSNNKDTDDDTIKMVEFLINNICVIFEGKVGLRHSILNKRCQNLELMNAIRRVTD